MDTNDFYPIIAGALSGAASAGVFKGPIQTLEDWWYIHFGHKVSEKADLLRAQQQINIEKLKNETLSETTKIDPQNVQNPKLFWEYTGYVYEKALKKAPHTDQSDKSAK